MGSRRGQTEFVEVRLTSQRSDGPHIRQKNLTEVRGSSQKSYISHRGKVGIPNFVSGPREYIWRENMLY